MKKEKIAIGFARYALAASYLSAVADRFGLWGKPGASGVAWGNMENFLSYTATLLWFVPKTFVPTFGWAATITELVLGLLFISGFKLKETALGSAALLASFFITMTMANGIKGPLDYSVLSACAASLMIASFGDKNETSTH